MVAFRGARGRPPRVEDRDTPRRRGTPAGAPERVAPAIVPSNRGETMANPVPAGSDVSAGTYRCTQCGYPDRT
jgi:hypothetical protein